MAQNHAGAMRLGGQAKERQLLQGAVFPVAKQTWPAKSHLRRRRFSAHRHLPHAQGRNHSPGPRLRLFRPASSRNQGEAVGKPDRQAWLRSHLAAHRQGGLKCKKERTKNQCLNVLFLFRSEATKQSISPRKERMDCFVASAPRKDDGMHAQAAQGQISNTCPGFNATKRSRGIFASSSAACSPITGASIASSVN